MLLSQISKFFGESNSSGSQHFSINSISIDSLSSKIEDKAYIHKIADALIKLENYDGANKLYEHIELLSKLQSLSDEKSKAVAEEQYDIAKALKNEISDLKRQLMNPDTMIDLIHCNTENKHLTLRNILELVIQRVDDPFALYFVPYAIEKYNRIEHPNFQRKTEIQSESSSSANSKIKFKTEIMIESLVLFKISVIGLDCYKRNLELLVPFLLKEIEENYISLKAMKNFGEEVLDIIREDQKFTVFLKGIKALYQVAFNTETSLEIISKARSQYSTEFEQYLKQIKLGLNSIKNMINILDSDIGISSKLLNPLLMKSKILDSVVALEDSFSSIYKNKYNNM